MRRDTAPDAASLSDPLRPSPTAPHADDGASSGSPHGGSPIVVTGPAIDQQRVTAAGIRRLDSKHVTLYTDLAESPEVDELPHVFDLAVEQWCAYFRIGPDNVETWRMTGYLMDRKERYQGTGLLPDNLPAFLNGYQRGAEMWVYEQPTAYYRRHMLLHEGTHAFMQWQLGGAGPPWYMEGTAELLGTHLWEDGKLQLAYFPHSRDELDHWGRIKIVRTEVEAGRLLSLAQIAAYGPTAHLRNEPYGWCWAAAAFLDGHPDFSLRFRQLTGHVKDSPQAFSDFFFTSFDRDMRQLVEQWQLFVLNIDYGYDVRREAVVYEPLASTPRESASVEIRADRGWQSTGFRVAEGTPYEIQATGRYQVASAPKVWWCEPNGVTIRYHGGRPLGALLAAVSDVDEPLTGTTPLAQPEMIGLGRDIEFSHAGTLFLRVNDSPAELADNAGQIRVDIRRKP